MDARASNLEQLRIDRPPEPLPRPVSVTRWLALGTAAVAVAVAAWLVFKPTAVVVRAAVAQAVPASHSASPRGGSLLDASGYVVPMRQATISAKSIYKVNEVLVELGESVAAGKIVARLDDSNTHAALAQSLAQVKQLEAMLSAATVAAADARPTFLRAQQQLTEGLISPDTFDASKSSYDAAQAAVEVAKRNLEVAARTVEINTRFEDDTVIRAPFAGVVTAKSAQPGEIVSPQFVGGGGIATIVDMDSLEVDVDVNENYISRLGPEQPAQITLNAYPDWRIPAQIIAIIPTADRSKATVQVRVGFKNKDARILPQMGARVSFLNAAPSVADKRHAAAGTSVLVPLAAVDGSGNAGSVFVIRGDTVDRRAVRLGERAADRQTVLAGLEPGTRVAIGDLAALHDGVRIRVTP